MNAPDLPAAGGRTTLYHRRHAWQKRVRTLSHFGPAVLLLLAMSPVLNDHEPLTLLVGVEVAVGAAYLTLMVRELRHLRHNPFHREPVAWLELAAAGILALESYHIWHRHHEAELASGVHNVHFLPWIYAALAVAYVVMAFRLPQMDGRRFLHLHADGFALRTKRLGRSCELSWADIDYVEPAGPADLLVHRRDGEHQRLSFAGLHDEASHRDRLLGHLRANLTGGTATGDTAG